MGRMAPSQLGSNSATACRLAGRPDRIFCCLNRRTLTQRSARPAAAFAAHASPRRRAPTASRSRPDMASWSAPPRTLPRLRSPRCRYNVRCAVTEIVVFMIMEMMTLILMLITLMMMMGRVKLLEIKKRENNYCYDYVLMILPLTELVIHLVVPSWRASRTWPGSKAFRARPDCGGSDAGARCATAIAVGINSLLSLWRCSFGCKPVGLCCCSMHTGLWSHSLRMLPFLGAQ